MNNLKQLGAAIDTALIGDSSLETPLA